MALQKTIQSRAGFDMEYWKIASWYINMSQNIMDITLVPYISMETRGKGLMPIVEEARKIRIYDRIDKFNPKKSQYDYTDNFSPEALEDSSLDIYKLMYKYIKDNVEEFEGATDA